MSCKPAPDWEAVSAHYRATRSVKQTAAKFGLSLERLKARIRRESWGKDDSAYDQLRLAFEFDTGTTLTADQVQALMRDTAIYDAVMQTHE